jgi:predicted nucleic acid-binding protein
MRAVLVDAGPLVALLDRSDAYHGEVVATLRKIHDPLLSVWPVLVEAMYLLSFSWQAQKALWEIFETGTVQLLALEEEDIAPIKNLMEKYRDVPMDLADAALVRVAEREGLRQVLTLDQRDFNVYRLPRKGRFTLLP